MENYPKLTAENDNNDVIKIIKFPMNTPLETIFLYIEEKRKAFKLLLKDSELIELAIQLLDGIEVAYAKNICEESLISVGHMPTYKSFKDTMLVMFPRDNYISKNIKDFNEINLNDGNIIESLFKLKSLNNNIGHSDMVFMQMVLQKIPLHIKKSIGPCTNFTELIHALMFIEESFKKASTSPKGVPQGK